MCLKDPAETCQLLIFSSGLIYVTLVGTEAATFGSPAQRANHCANETLIIQTGKQVPGRQVCIAAASVEQNRFAKKYYLFI